MIEELYLYADRNEIGILPRHHHSRAAFCVKYEKHYFISIDYAKIHTRYQEQDIIAEEIGHCCSDSLYYLEDIRNPLRRMNIDKAERRAADWAASFQVPLYKLYDPKLSLIPAAEFAEELGVSLDTLCKAIDYYKRKELIRIEDDELVIA